MNTPNLDLSIAKLITRHLAEHAALPDAESLLSSLRETVAFLERRIAREKVLQHKTLPVIEYEGSAAEVAEIHRRLARLTT